MATGLPDNVKGVCANAATKRIYISTTRTLTCLDLVTEKILWERSYEGGCDRMSMTPDGSTIFLPSFEKDHWHVVDARNGDVLAKIVPRSGAHNTIVGLNGREAYLAGLRSPFLTVAGTASRKADRTVGSFSRQYPPLHRQQPADPLLCQRERTAWFRSGRPDHRQVTASRRGGRIQARAGQAARLPEPRDRSHPRRERVVGGRRPQRARPHLRRHDQSPKQLKSLKVRDEPGWLTFTLDGRYAYPSTGDVIETATRKIVAGLTDEHGTAVQSEKMLEIDFEGDQPIRNGDQFGLGRLPLP